MAAGHEDTFHHVRDFPYFELPQGIHIDLPNIFGLQLSKFMVLQVVAGLLTLLIFKGLAKRVTSGEPATGAWWNFWEMLALFVRDEVVRPTLGAGHEHGEHGHDEHGHDDSHDHDHGGHANSHVGAGAAHAVSYEPHGATLDAVAGHPADAFLPYIWSCFFYVLFCNLLGAIPWMGSATGNLNVTGALALITFAYVIYCGSQVSGFVGFWKSLVPGMDLPGPLKIVLIPMIWAIELLGLFIKHGVLAVRLFANIMAGHTVIAVVLGFIALSAHSGWWYVITPASIFGQVAIGMLELFVAFLQAYVFAFLATLFISAAVHPH